MPVSNAERQRRFRQRAATALRNAKRQDGRLAAAPMSVPHALVLGAREDGDELSTQTVAKCVYSALIALNVPLYEPNRKCSLGDAAIIAMFGGQNYVASVFTWHAQRQKLRLHRDKDKVPAPPLPAT